MANLGSKQECSGSRTAGSEAPLPTGLTNIKSEEGKGAILRLSIWPATRTQDMETINADIIIMGAGGAGLRAAIALAETDPALRVALISKVYPMRSHTCAAEGGAAGVIKPDDSFDMHFDDTVGGGDWLSDQDCVEYFIHEAP